MSADFKRPEMNWIRALTALACAVAFLLIPLGAPPASQGRPVDLELVLAIDASSSVDDAEFRMQTRGLASAFRDPQVIAAIMAAGSRGVAVAVVQWSEERRQELAVDWVLVRDVAGTLRLAELIAAAPRLVTGGHTAAGNALDFAARTLDDNAYLGLRRVIDISGDGRVNDGLYPHAVRDAAVGRGITINGLAILNEIPLLEQYYREHLIGGAGAFVMTAADYADFTRAMVAKLVREIRSAPLTLGPQRFPQTSGSG